ncbi:hypothetical protein B1810_11150 [Panacagrimonas perspica]|nr:hypothetical protein B1810_11150 [Panacagrimonas perspica]
MPTFNPRIDATAELVDPEVEQLARQQFIDIRLRWLAQWTADLVSQGLRATCEVTWARKEYEAVIGKVLEIGVDLVVKDLRRDSVLHRWSAIRSSDWRLTRLCPVPVMLVQADAPLLPSRIAAAVNPTHPEAHPAGLDDRVVKTALPIAMTCGASLELLHVFPYRREDEGMAAKMDELIGELREEDRLAFNRFADRNSVPQEQRMLLGGDPVTETLRHTETAGIGLLVIGSRYRSGLDRFILGSNAEALVSQATCDLLVVRPEDFGRELTRHRALEALERHEAARTAV